MQSITESQYNMSRVRPGVRHVRGVRPNRAADFRELPILTSFI